MTEQPATPSDPIKPPEPSQLPWHPLTALLVVVAVYFTSMAIGQAALSVYPLLRGWSEAQTSAWQASSTFAQFAYVLVVEALTLGLIYVFMRSRHVTLRTIGLLQPRLRDAGIALIAYPPYFLLNAVATITAVSLLSLNIDQGQQIGFEHVKGGGDLILTAISLVVLPPIVEEIVMRGFLFGSLKKDLSVVRAAIVTSVIFALAHLQFGSGAPLLWVAAIDTFILSLVLCYLRQKTGSLWPGIGLHMIKNSLAFGAIFISPLIHWHL